MVRLLLSAAMAAGLVATAATPAQAAPLVTCQFKITGTWPGGYAADLIIVNNGPTAINGWVTRWTVDVPTQLGAVWWAYMVMPTPLEMIGTNLPWNPVVPAGGQTSFGWTAIAPSADVPTDITLNGALC
jgi:hypothetical protein